MSMLSHASFVCLVLSARTSFAQTPPSTPAPVPQATSLTPQPVEAKPVDTKGGTTTQFVADPVGDGGVLAISVGVVSVLELIQSTGEIRPQQPAANAQLLWIDKLARRPHTSAASVSTALSGELTMDRRCRPQGPTSD